MTEEEQWANLKGSAATIEIRRSLKWFLAFIPSWRNRVSYLNTVGGPLANTQAKNMHCRERQQVQITQFNCFLSNASIQLEAAPKFFILLLLFSYSNAVFALHGVYICVPLLLSLRTYKSLNQLKLSCRMKMKMCFNFVFKSLYTSSVQHVVVV